MDIENDGNVIKSDVIDRQRRIHPTAAESGALPAYRMQALRAPIARVEGRSQHISKHWDYPKNIV